MRTEFITWFFSIATLTIFFSITIPVDSQCLEDQKSLLLQLKSSLEFDPDSSVKLMNWAGTEDCCQWNGVTCNRFGRVIGLDLNTDSISGGLNDSSSLFGLEFLEKLDLANNSFNRTEIPSSFGGLTNLRFTGTIPQCLVDKVTATLSVLNLQNNSLTGNIMGAFPEGCTLRTLELNGNKLEGEIPNSLANCANAEVLNFGTNNINGNFPCFLANLSELRILVLRSNKFYGNIGCQGIHNYLWPKLQIIDLALNNFSGILPPNFFSQRKAMMDGVHSKCLEDQKFYVASIEEEPQVRFKFLCQVGKLASNQQLLSVEWRDLSELHVLVLRSNNCILPPKFFSQRKAMMDGGNAQSNLNHLRFETSRNIYKDSVTVVIKGSKMKMVKILTIFTTIDFSNNRFKGEIPDIVRDLKALYVLNLSHNALIGSIPSSLGNLSKH
ncbi:hypothetical protein RHSIM_Rhsim05G0221100 [Rhododendron simsii]|uniref:Leucine-rich repeat-containing N-terminal plant-type domain-containing protein n=1 Tax=Rhododendron simsii TaxID=118357 RepID=A0A834GY54_RHOSS|nr:hypothetical protein RHSIM_Rhsim05G0221100 [Rhododendron simsii]